MKNKKFKERNILYICTEIYSREYDEYLMLSLDILENTNIKSVIIANQQILKFMLRKLPIEPGFVLVKSAQENQKIIYQEIQKMGHTIICQNAEFCVTWPDEGKYDLKMISHNTLKYVDCILTHNMLETSLLKEFKKINKIPSEIIEIGNIRFLRDKKTYNSYYKNYIKNRIQNKNSKFILFVSSLGPSNLYKGLSREEIYNFLIKSDSTEKSHAERLSYQYFYHQFLYKEFAEVIEELNISSENICCIVRPHPSDDINQLKQIFNGIPNIQIIEENSFKPWALASTLVISSSSSTLIESTSLDINSISFLPSWPDDKIDLVNYFRNHQVNKTSFQSYSKEDLKNNIKNFYNDPDYSNLSQINEAKEFLGIKEDRNIKYLYEYISKNKKMIDNYNNKLFLPFYIIKPAMQIIFIFTELYKFLFYRKSYRNYLSQKNTSFNKYCIKFGAMNHLKKYDKIISMVKKNYTFLRKKD